MKEKKKKSATVRIIMAIVVFLLLSAVGVYAATTILSSNISYDNTKSGITSTNLNGAIDELYEQSDIRRRGRFVSAYTYNETAGASTYCVTGEESTCKRNTCYQNKTAGSCKAGDIIKYKVNDTDIVAFHVVYDKGNTLTMQSQKNIINKTAWISKSDYVSAGGIQDDFGLHGNSKMGPLTILNALEKATLEWSNVNNQTYTMGSGTNDYTGCTYLSCTANIYTLQRTAKVRMLTLQEAKSFGCSTSLKSCEKWITPSTTNWLSSAVNDGSRNTAWYLGKSGDVNVAYVNDAGVIGVRAVIVVNK